MTQCGGAASGVAISVGVAWGGVACAGPTFQSMGHLGTGGPITHAYDVSADGEWAVGEATGSRGFMWSELTGMVQLGAGPGNTNLGPALITGVSNGGLAAAGSRQVGLGSPFPVRWTYEHGMENLGDLPGGSNFGRALDISGDGAVVVGYSHSELGPEAFSWREGSEIVGLGRLPGHNYSLARGVSGEGRRIVGFSSIATITENDTTPCLWVDGGPIQALAEPGVPGEYNSVADAISEDGRYIAGHANNGSDHAIRWNPDGTFTMLGTIAGGTGGSGYGVSNSGLVVGVATTPAGIEACLWTPEHGMRALEEVLTVDYGLNLEGWSLTSANGISADGTTIVGGGRDPTGRFAAWVAVIPAPGALGLLGVGGVLVLASRSRR